MRILLSLLKNLAMPLRNNTAIISIQSRRSYAGIFRVTNNRLSCRLDKLEGDYGESLGAIQKDYEIMNRIAGGIPEVRCRKQW